VNPYVANNRKLWDEWTEINYRSAFYDVDGFKREPDPLDDDVLAGVGDLAGKSVLHLQCHFGMDTLRLARLAREAVGVDFSPAAIARARALAAETGIAARFVETDLYELALDEQFDVVFSSYGVIGWLPDLVRWGQVIARHLKPGGRFFLIEGHPTMWMFDSDTPDLAFKYPYFAGEPNVLPPIKGMYSDPDATWTHSEYSWSHPLCDVFGALLGAGLRIDEFREYRHCVWRPFSFAIEETPDHWVMPPGMPQLPMMFSIRASR
jgi:SAM-dependent methyltransferase